MKWLPLHIHVTITSIWFHFSFSIVFFFSLVFVVMENYLHANIYTSVNWCEICCNNNSNSRTNKRDFIFRELTKISYKATIILCIITAWYSSAIKQYGQVAHGMYVCKCCLLHCIHTMVSMLVLLLAMTTPIIICAKKTVSIITTSTIYCNKFIWQIVFRLHRMHGTMNFRDDAKSSWYSIVLAIVDKKIP